MIILTDTVNDGLFCSLIGRDHVIYENAYIYYVFILLYEKYLFIPIMVCLKVWAHCIEPFSFL